MGLLSLPANLKVASLVLVTQPGGNGIATEDWRALVMERECPMSSAVTSEPVGRQPEAWGSWRRASALRMLNNRLDR